MFKAVTIDGILKVVTTAVSQLDALAAKRGEKLEQIKEQFARLQVERLEAQQEQDRALRIAQRLKLLVD